MCKQDFTSDDTEYAKGVCVCGQQTVPCAQTDALYCALQMHGTCLGLQLLSTFITRDQYALEG